MCYKNIKSPIKSKYKWHGCLGFGLKLSFCAPCCRTLKSPEAHRATKNLVGSFRKLMGLWGEWGCLLSVRPYAGALVAFSLVMLNKSVWQHLLFSFCRRENWGSKRLMSQKCQVVEPGLKKQTPINRCGDVEKKKIKKQTELSGLNLFW